MPAVLAIPAFWAAVSAAGAGAATIYAANKSSNAARDSATLATNSANHGADLQKQSADAALAFQQKQADLDRLTAETNRHADYDQWAAQQRRIGSIGELVGLGPRDIPGYVPMPNGLPSSQTTPNSGQTPAGADPKAVAFIRDWQSKNSPTSSPADLVKAAQAAGVNITPFMYQGGVASNNEVTVPGVGKFKIKGGEDGPNPSWYYGGNDSAPGAASSPYGSIGSVGSYVGATTPQFAALPMTSTLAPAPNPYRVGAVGAYL